MPLCKIAQASSSAIGGRSLLFRQLSLGRDFASGLAVKMQRPMLTTVAN